MKLDEATIDRLRELGATDDMLKWLEQPEAVRTLLKLSPYNDAERCEACDEDANDAHLRTCTVAAAWRTLGDPRGAADIEMAELEAHKQEARRMRLARRLNDSLNSLMRATYPEALASGWIGPCAHGRDPFDRCDHCKSLTDVEAWALAQESRPDSLVVARESVDAAKEPESE